MTMRTHTIVTHECNRCGAEAFTPQDDGLRTPYDSSAWGHIQANYGNGHPCLPYERAESGYKMELCASCTESFVQWCAAVEKVQA